jgi:hypothetical protein
MHIGIQRDRSGVRLLSKSSEWIRATVEDPVEVALKVVDVVAERRERRRMPSGLYRPEANWEARLHGSLGSAWPCTAVEEFWQLWPQVMSRLATQGLEVGRGAFGGWGDGEPGMARAIWCIVVHSRPKCVVETGVARGITTRFILEALKRNGSGHLWSVDLPPQLKRELHDQIGAAVLPEIRARWTYVRGSSRRRLPGVLRETKSVDLFVHARRHTERNVSFELDRVWRSLDRLGTLVVDDIDLNRGFDSFVAAHRQVESLICEAEPLRPDPSRFAQKGLFGIIRKRDVDTNVTPK